MQRLHEFLLVGAIVGSAAACGGNSNNPFDASTPSDTPSADIANGDTAATPDGTTPMDSGGTPTDATPTDTGGTPADAPMTPDNGVEDAGPVGNPCATGAVINLNTAGTLSGTTTTYTGDTSTVAATGSLPVPTACSVTVGYELALQYTPHTTGTHLLVSTVNPGTAFDTVVWEINTCATAGSSLGCNDDNPAGDDPETASEFVTTASVTAGTPVFIVVAGYDAGDGSGGANGAFVLSVSEIPQVALGAACDPAGMTNTCPAAASCITAGATSTCIADGTMGGACVGTAGTCNAGLTCSPAGTCLPTVAVGALCDSLGLTNVCATGSSCIGTCPTARCVTDGTAGGDCSSVGSTPCGTGLGCTDSGFCVTAVAAGAPCDPTEVTNVCADGSTCVGVGTAARCNLDGTLGADCMDVSGDCGTGLTCTDFGLCLPAAGASGGPCNATGTACNAGLACDGPPAADGTLCEPAVAVGAACDPTGLTNACTAPALCATTGTTSTCVAVSYTETSLASPTFLDACGTGTHVVLANCGTDRDTNHSLAAQTIPFTFAFYGSGYTKVWPDTNGYAVFGATAPFDSAGGTGSVPNYGEGAALAPFWDDLVLRAAPTSDICVVTTGSAPNRQYVIEWLDVYVSGYADTTVTFEAVLHETTNAVDFLYQHLDATMAADATQADGSMAAIGLQSYGGTASQVHTGTASTTAGITFTPH